MPGIFDTLWAICILTFLDRSNTHHNHSAFNPLLLLKRKGIE